MIFQHNYVDILQKKYMLFPICLFSDVAQVGSDLFWRLIVCQVLNGTPLLGGFLIGSCIVFMTFVVLNLLISVILVAFNQEQMNHKVTTST